MSDSLQPMDCSTPGFPVHLQLFAQMNQQSQQEVPLLFLSK